MIVPGVTSRTTSRLTTDFAPRFFASAGSSSCSHTATRWPSAISRLRYSSARSTGTPHMRMSSPSCLPRLVSTMPSARLADLRVLEEQLVEVAHPVEQQAVRIGRLDLEILRHHRRQPGGDAFRAGIGAGGFHGSRVANRALARRGGARISTPGGRLPQAVALRWRRAFSAIGGHGVSAVGAVDEMQMAAIAVRGHEQVTCAPACRNAP